MISMACIMIVRQRDRQLFDSVVLRDLLGPSSQTNRQLAYTDRQTDRQQTYVLNKHTQNDRQTNRQTHRQTDKPTHRQKIACLVRFFDRTELPAQQRTDSSIPRQRQQTRHVVIDSQTGHDTELDISLSDPWCRLASIDCWHRRYCGLKEGEEKRG